MFNPMSCGSEGQLGWLSGFPYFWERFDEFCVICFKGLLRLLRRFSAFAGELGKFCLVQILGGSL